MAINIIAIEVISMSELTTIMPELKKEYLDENPEVLKKMFYDLGIESYRYPVDESHCTHRNRFNNIVTDWRWCGNSRMDKEWLNSLYASQAAKDRAIGSKLLIESYSKRGETDLE